MLWNYEKQCISFQCLIMKLNSLIEISDAKLLRVMITVTENHFKNKSLSLMMNTTVSKSLI